MQRCFKSNSDGEVDWVKTVCQDQPYMLVCKN